MTKKKNFAWMILMIGLLISLGFMSNSARAKSADLPRGEMRSAVGFDYELVTVPVSNDRGEMSPKLLGSITTPADAGCTLDTTGAISYWQLDEGAGATTFVDSKGGHNGTCSDPKCPTGVSGAATGAQFFIKTDADVINVPSTTAYDWTKESNFSVGMWVKTTQDCTGNKVFVGRYRNNPSTEGTWWVGCVPGSEPGEGVARFSLRDSISPNGVEVTGSTVINDGKWHFITGVRVGFDPDPLVLDDDKNLIYVDGVLEVGGTVTNVGYTGNFTSTDVLTMGAYHENDDYYFNGALDEVVIFGSVWDPAAYYATCTFAPNVGDVLFEIDTGLITELPISEGELLAHSTGTGLSITSFDITSEKVGSIVSPQIVPPYTDFTYTPPALYDGTDFFTFVVSDGVNTASGTAVINVIAEAPVVTQPDDQEDNEGDPVSLPIVAEDPNDDVMTYAATNLPTGLSINLGTGLITGTVAYTAAEGSPTKVYSVTVTVTDDSPEANETSVDFTWTINRVNMAPVLVDPGPQVNYEGDVVSLQIEATDANEDTLTYWESGLPPGLAIDTSTGLIDGTISGATVSTYSVSVTVTDIDALSDQVDFDWVITDENRPPVITQPPDQEDYEGETIIPLQIAALDPDGDTLTYSADGLPDGLDIDSAGLITGTIAVGASSSSPYDVTVTVEDPDGLKDSAIFSWTVKSLVKNLYLPIVTK